MSDATQVLQRIAAGDGLASAELLPLVYEELRRLAARELSREAAPLTLQPTALVHEAYLRLVDQPAPQNWDHRGHFFAAAAQAMRRILVELARQRHSLKRGGEWTRSDLDAQELSLPEAPARLVELDEALTRLATHDEQAARLVELRYFAGLTMAQTAEALGLSERSAFRTWDYAKAWLYRALNPSDP